MNVAVVFDGTLLSGGGYQQQLAVMLELRKLDGYNLIAFVLSEDNVKVLESYNIPVVYCKRNKLQPLFSFILRQECFWGFMRKLKYKSMFERKLEANDIDLVYFLSPSNLALDLVAHNYVMTVWDLCHRDMPEFPEVNNYREFELRDSYYSRVLPKAVAVITDSDLGRANVIHRYGVERSRVFVTPFYPSFNIKTKIEVDVRSKYLIDGDYIYYPAQLWPHKNHVYIVEAIKFLQGDGINITAVFSGSDKGNLSHVMGYANQLNIGKLVRYLGFVPNEDVYSLYKNAFAMVMPSYFGPTNIPPLEAFMVGIPVVCSDLPGMREQVGDAALLCDLNNPSDLAAKLKKLRVSETRDSLINKGYKRFSELECNSLINILRIVFSKHSKRLKCWK